METGAPPVCFVFVPGFWHSSSYWRPITAHLEAAGHRTRAVDLPGAGLHAANPVAYTQYNAAALATEPSPSAHITQDSRTDALVRVIEEEAALGQRVVLVTHSAGGYTAVPAVERAHASLYAAVYIAAIMLPPAMMPHEFRLEPCMADVLIPACFVADPAAVGAARIDFRSQESQYVALLKQTFAGDADDATWARFLAEAGMHCDEPASTFLTKSPMTAERFGRVPRVYIRLSKDRAVPPAAQDWCVAAVDAAMGNPPTVVHRLECAHSPMLTQPQVVVDILLDTARGAAGSA